MDFDRALDNLRTAVKELDRSLRGTPDHGYWEDQVNQAAYEVMVQIHHDFPNQFNHPGPYRPLVRGNQQ